MSQKKQKKTLLHCLGTDNALKKLLNYSVGEHTADLLGVPKSHTTYMNVLLRMFYQQLPVSVDTVVHIRCKSHVTRDGHVHPLAGVDTTKNDHPWVSS